MKTLTDSEKKFMAGLDVFCRVVLGLVFAFSGLVKALDPLGTVYKIEDYLKAFGGFWTDLMPLAGVAAVCLILTECVLAWVLLSNTWRKTGSVLTLLFYCVMLPLTFWISITNPVSDCGCFGDAIVLTNQQTFIKNVFLFGLAFSWFMMVWFISEPGKLHKTGQWLWPGLGLILNSLLMIYTVSYIPLVDFRPYKVGADLIKMLEIPEDAPADVYKTTLIYADQDGNEKEFTLENYPKNDPNWTFVDQKSELVSKGYESPIHDFIIYDNEDNDITYDILEAEDTVTLCILYDLKRADKGAAIKVAALAAKTENLYILTGSGEEEIAGFEFPEEVPVCFCDPVTLKTIVRANPGVVVLNHGVITKKYHL